MRAPLTRLIAGAVAFVSLGIGVGVTSASATQHPSINYLKLSMATAYAPRAAHGTDDYHCSLINPHVSSDSYIVSSLFLPGDNGKTEVHHAILFMIPPSWAAAATTANNGGKGWTCFGETVLSGAQVGIPGGGKPTGQPTWLTGWAPGDNLHTTPQGTGVLFPKGSLVVMQIHYNMLVSRKAIKSSLTLGTVPVSPSIKPLSLDLFPAPPDVPCLAKWHPASTPLCSRAASLKNLALRFGKSAVNFVNILETACGRSASSPPAGDTTSCTWRYFHTADIVEIGAHMHLTGSSMRVVLNPGTSGQKVLLNDTNFNFDNQISYKMSSPVHVVPGDKVQVTCTYNPIVHDINPQLRDAPHRFVTWGDGSSDEMCLALISTIN